MANPLEGKAALVGALREAAERARKMREAVQEAARAGEALQPITGRPIPQVRLRGGPDQTGGES